MKSKSLHKHRNPIPRKIRPSKGFALVATLSILSLTVIISLAMLSLAQTSLKSSEYNAAMEKAKANAKIALAQAISELQRLSGADTRITAPADILVSSAPALTGVWKSWEGKNHDTDGRPIAPDYGLKLLEYTEPASPSDPDNSDGRFLGFLVSGADKVTNPVSANLANLVSSAASNSTVALLSTGSLGSNPGQVHVPPQMFGDDSGAYAWWISPENQKARLMQPHKPQNDDAAGWAGLSKSHAVPDTGEFGLNAYNSDQEEFVPSTTTPVKPVSKVVSRDTMSLLGSTNTSGPNFNFHDYSSSAIGLLTNSSTGGWKKDLSILTEKWNDIYKISSFNGSGFPVGTSENVELPLFRYSPKAGDTSSVPLPTVEKYDHQQSSLYPWNNHHQIGTTKYPVTYHTASASWQSLTNFATHYKKLTFNSSYQAAKGPFGWKSIVSNHQGKIPSDNVFYRYYHDIELSPIVARVQLIVQAQAIPHPEKEHPAPEDFHLVNLRCVPLVTLWNPHSVTISKELVGSAFDKTKDLDFGIGTQRSLPITMAIINGSKPPTNGFEGEYRFLNGGNAKGLDGDLVGPGGKHYYDWEIDENHAQGLNGSKKFFGDLRAVTAWLPVEFELGPGQAKVFAPKHNRFGSWSAGSRLKEGYAAGDDAGLAVVDTDSINPNKPSSYNALYKVPGRWQNKLLTTDMLRFSMKSDRYTKLYSDRVSNKVGGGTFFSVGTSHWPKTAAEIENGQVPKAATYLRSVMAVNPHMDWNKLYWPNDDMEEIQYPVSELVPGGGNPEWTNIFSISVGPRLTFGAGNGNPTNRPTRGMLMNSPFATNCLSLPEKKSRYHPANNPFEMSYSTIPINSDLAPEVGNSGYIATGFQAGEGLSKLVLSELPLSPIASVGELQSWNLRGGNPLPPFQHNLIGNSEATPLIQKNSILPNELMSNVVSQNLQHDDAYCGNHLLFDDCFFSSIAPKPNGFGGSISKDMNTVYKDFLQGKGMLTNRAYLPIREDQWLSDAKVDARVSEVLDSSDGLGFMRVASRLEVKGMFNVNSTSVKAWRAILGHVRARKVAFHNASNGIDVDPNSYDHVVLRNSVASDVKAGPSSGAGAIFPNGSEYTGFRTLSGSQLDELAEKIVEQVRLRGPFLSLSEFVNRQLSNNDDLAIAGALQVALDSLTDDPNAELKKDANQLSEKTMDVNDPKLAGVGYAFPKAAEGYSTHGFPGWIRQADILRPLAPVLTPRDDTFTIRAYGDARDADGNIIARAWCEATVNRSREFVNGIDDADSIEPPLDPLNQKFGRKYKIISFSWLKANEV